MHGSSSGSGSGSVYRCIVVSLYRFLVVAENKGYPFLSILLSLKTIGKGVKFQDVTLIRATFTNTIANGINNSYPF